jgi:hypothetical protein
MSLDRAARLRRRAERRRLMEFNMLTFTKQDSILIAVTLGTVFTAHRPSYCRTMPEIAWGIYLNITTLAAIMVTLDRADEGRIVVYPPGSAFSSGTFRIWR